MLVLLNIPISYSLQVRACAECQGCYAVTLRCKLVCACHPLCERIAPPPGVHAQLCSVLCPSCCPSLLCTLEPFYHSGIREGSGAIWLMVVNKTVNVMQCRVMYWFVAMGTLTAWLPCHAEVSRTPPLRV